MITTDYPLTMGVLQLGVTDLDRSLCDNGVPLAELDWAPAAGWGTGMGAWDTPCIDSKSNNTRDPKKIR